MAYFDSDGLSLREIAKRVKAGDKPYDTVSFVDTAELASIRDYNWNRNNLRDGSVPDGPPDKEGCPTKYRRGVDGPERWDGLVDWMREYGWNCDPAHVHVGRDGKMKLAEGNHRLAVAETIKLPRVPVLFHARQEVSRTSETSREPRQLAGVRCAGGRTDSAKWRAAKLTAKAEACRSGSRRCGTWDARMAQRAGQLYRQAGGGYCGPKTPAQRSLKKWTDEKWTTATGEKACRKVRGKIVCDRYLPAAAWKKLSPAERAATRRVKKAGRTQFVPNTPAARAAGRAARRAK